MRPYTPFPSIPSAPRALAFALVLTGLFPAPGRAQAVEAIGPDSTRVFGLETIVVTADRSATRLATATAAVSVLDRGALDRLPIRTIAEALQHLPGFALLNFDGLGFDPVVAVRGFYGGGEAEYVVVLLDGQPLNGLEAGLVSWDQIPISAVERIEIVRGGTSALYGDAAIGATINIITREDADLAAFRGQIGVGGMGIAHGAARARGNVADRPVAVFADARRSSGFRDHAERFAASAGGTMELLRRPTASLSLVTVHHWHDQDDPGPLADAALAASRTQASVFHRFDHAIRRQHRLALAGRFGHVDRELRAYVAGEIGSEEGTRTIPLAATFADTKAHETSTRRLLGSAQIRRDGLLADADRLTAGIDGSVGGYDIDYFHVLTGDETAYRDANGTRGDRVAGGSIGRGAAGAFVVYELWPTDALRLSIGGRFDWLSDRFEPNGGSGDATATAEHTAFSPKLGANLRYLATTTQRGHVYANWGRSFKAPTLEQLFDPRPVPVPFPPYAISFSSALLEPQHGTSAEIGLYHGVTTDLLEATLSLSAYRMDTEDEIDFDLGAFRYVNIGRSRHQGIEAGLALSAPAGLSASLAYTLQDVSDRETPERQLKAVPRHTLGAAVSWSHRAGPTVSLASTTLRGIWLDDANTIELPGFTRVDARLSIPLLRARVTLDVHNLLDAAYNTTGFPDTAGSGTVFYYPAAGRVLQLALSLDR